MIRLVDINFDETEMFGDQILLQRTMVCLINDAMKNSNKSEINCVIGYDTNSKLLNVHVF